MLYPESCILVVLLVADSQFLPVAVPEVPVSLAVTVPGVPVRLSPGQLPAQAVRSSLRKGRFVY